MALHAPFGTDEQPSVNVKIVAGKALEVERQNDGKYNNLARTPYKYSSRPPWFLDDFPGETKRSNKPYLASISSLSTNNSQEEAVWKHHQNGEPKSVGGRTVSKQEHDNLSETEAVDFMLSRLLSQFPASKFKEIYTEMAGFDPRLTSYITEHQVETTLKRHKVPIPSTILKLLLDKFASEAKRNMINYENLIKYLFSYSLKGSSLKAVSHERKPSSEVKVHNINNHEAVSKQTSLAGETLDSPRTDQSSYMSPRSLVKKAMDDREEAYLLVQIEQAFKVSGQQVLTTLEKLHNDLRKLGNGTEYVRGDQIERICSWLHLPLHHSLLEKILSRFDVKKNGKINWTEFIGFLEKGIPLSIRQNSHVSEKVNARSPLPFWESQTPLASVSPRKHAEQEMSVPAGIKDEPPCDENVVKNERKKWDVPPATMDIDSKPQHNLESSYDILRFGRNNSSADTEHVMQFNQSTAGGEKPDTTDSEKTAETLDEKLERLSHLTAALLRSDVDKTGTLKARDVIRIVNNYNLIYSLHFPEEKVLEITQRCTLPDTHDVYIDELARALWELMKTV